MNRLLSRCLKISRDGLFSPIQKQTIFLSTKQIKTKMCTTLPENHDFMKKWELWCVELVYRINRTKDLNSCIVPKEFHQIPSNLGVCTTIVGGICFGLYLFQGSYHSKPVGSIPLIFTQGFVTIVMSAYFVRIASFIQLQKLITSNNFTKLMTSSPYQFSRSIFNKSLNYAAFTSGFCLISSTILCDHIKWGTERIILMFFSEPPDYDITALPPVDIPKEEYERQRKVMENYYGFDLKNYIGPQHVLEGLGKYLYLLAVAVPFYYCALLVLKPLGFRSLNHIFAAHKVKLNKKIKISADKMTNGSEFIFGYGNK